jgi:guanylate kinase
MKKIILVGKGGSGKDYLKNHLGSIGLRLSVSSTTRPPRIGEVAGVDYNFEEILNSEYYIELQEFNGWFYGTSVEDWNNCNVFIMTPSGITSLPAEERKKAFVVYLDIQEDIREYRMSKRTGNADSVQRRLNVDRKDFKNFYNYDYIISSPYFNLEEQSKKIINAASKKSIWLDIDGVVADFNAHFLNYLNFEDKTPAKRWEDERFKNNWHLIAEDEIFWTTMPFIEENKKLINTENIRGFCTARSCPSQVTKEWFKMNGLQDIPVITVGLNGRKSDYLNQVGCELFVDDAVHNFEDLNNNGIDCYLMTRSHNLYYKTDKRINNLEILKTI